MNNEHTGVEVIRFLSEFRNDLRMIIHQFRQFLHHSYRLQEKGWYDRQSYRWHDHFDQLLKCYQQAGSYLKGR